MGDKAGILPTELGMLTPLLWRDGDIVGTTLPPKAGAPPVAGLLGEICHCPGGGGVPQELLELVLLRWLNPVVVVGGVPPSMNCTLGGESWHISGTLVNGGAEILRVAVRCRAAAGDLGLASGLTLACLRTPPGLCSGTNPASLSSGSGPRVEPPEAELIPDMAETESPDRLLERTKLA